MPAMDVDPDLRPAALAAPSLYPRRSLLLRRLAIVAQVVGLAAIVVGRGLWDDPERPRTAGAGAEIYRRIIQDGAVDPALFGDTAYGEPGYCPRLSL